MQQEIYHIRIPLEKKDEEFMHIQNLIELKRKLLLEKQKKLRVISKQNCFLDEVQKDYLKYYMYIVEQKQSQIKALQLLETYINDLTNSDNLTKHNIYDAKTEQRKILKEIKQIKNGLDALANDIDYINLSLREKTI